MKQLTFSRSLTVTKIYPDGKEEKLRFGQFESVMIVKENGLDVDRCRILTPPTCPVTEVECVDGTKLVFDEPFYFTEHK